MTIQEYFGDWAKVVDLQEAEKVMKRVLQGNRKTLCPCSKNIFRAFLMCPYSSLRVVILGQDPYNSLRNGKPVATGLAFANSEDTPQDSYSPSLDILRESVIDFTVPHNSIIFDPTLEKWSRQGVLMLNSALTCEVGRPGSHTLLWRPFMKSLLKRLSLLHTGVVYLLMGSDAQSLGRYIDKKSNHIITVHHPAWYARKGQKLPSSIWKDINSILIRINGYGIQWFEETDY